MGTSAPTTHSWSGLPRADTVLILDFSLTRCAWRALRRSRERADFWWWLLTWRHRVGEVGWLDFRVSSNIRSSEVADATAEVVPWAAGRRVTGGLSCGLLTWRSHQ